MTEQLFSKIWKELEVATHTPVRSESARAFYRLTQFTRGDATLALQFLRDKRDLAQGRARASWADERTHAEYYRLRRLVNDLRAELRAERSAQHETATVC